MQFSPSSEQALLIDSVDSRLCDKAPLDRVRRCADGGEARAADVVAGLQRLRLPTVDRSRHITEPHVNAVATDRLPSACPMVLCQVLAIHRAVLAADTLGASQRVRDQAVARAGLTRQLPGAPERRWLEATRLQGLAA